MSLVPPPPPPPMASPAFSGHSKIFAQVTPIPPALIRPTTAGLPPHSTLSPIDHTFSLSSPITRMSTNPPQIVVSDRALGSAQFKEELKEKQSKLTNSSVPVEERIMNNRQVQLRDATPEKLSTSTRSGKQPFTYSPDVSDPNNRGKLDLSQIKSPLMRKRLLANMSSVENELESMNGENVQDDAELENPIKPKEFEQIKVHHERPQEVVEHKVEIIRHQPTQFEGYQLTYHKINSIKSQSLENRKEPTTTNNTIQYNQPPHFYNYMPPHQEPKIEKRFSTISNKSTYLNNQGEKDKRISRIDELSNQVNESLNSLTKLVSDMEFTNGDKTARNNNSELRHKSYTQNSDHRISSFNNQRFENISNLSQAFPSQIVCNCNNDSSLMDYLTPTDSSYFSSSSSASPYSMNFYYGSPYEDFNYDIYNHNRPNVRSGSERYSPTNRRTFSPTGNN